MLTKTPPPRSLHYCSAACPTRSALLLSPDTSPAVLLGGCWGGRWVDKTRSAAEVRRLSANEDVCHFTCSYALLFIDTLPSHVLSVRLTARPVSVPRV